MPQPWRRVTLSHMSDLEVPARSAPDLASMRVRYVPGPLLESDVPPQPLDAVRAWLDDAVEAGLAEPNAMVVSTVEPDGRPSSRHVLLKEIDTTGFVFYTNLGSRKARAVAASPVAALCFPWFPMARQVSAVGRVEHVDRATAAAYWETRPRESQLGAWASRQSRPVASREALRAQLDEVARRFPEDAPVPLPEHWGGLRVVPDTVELWQGQPGRMHDRLAYERSDEGWTLTRLQP